MAGMTQSQYEHAIVGEWFLGTAAVARLTDNAWMELFGHSPRKFERIVEKYINIDIEEATYRPKHRKVTTC